MSATRQLPLRLAAKAATRLRAELEPFCERIEIAGSVRRRKATVGDLELVAIPQVERVESVDMFGQVAAVEARSLLDAHLDEMLAARPGPIFKSRAALFETVGLPPDGLPDVVRWGERYKRFYFLWGAAAAVIPVDLFLTTPDNFGAILTIRTGPHDFSREFVTHLKRATPYRQQDGMIVIEATGEVVPVPEERDYFELAGLSWIEPHHRTVAALRQALQREIR